MVVRNPLRHPDCALACRIRQNVEDPRLRGVAHHQHLSRPAVSTVEAVLLGKATHELDRLTSAAHALRGHACELIHAEERRTVRIAESDRWEGRRNSRLAKHEAALILYGVVSIVCDVRESSVISWLGGARRRGGAMECRSSARARDVQYAYV